MVSISRVKIRISFSICAVIGVLCSCSKDDFNHISPEVDIHFGVTMTDSRSLIEEPTAMGSFSVWAWRKHYDSSTQTNVFDNEVITYNQSTTSWTYEYPRSWNLNNTYNFYALYPDTLTDANFTEDGKLSFPRLDIRQTDEYKESLALDLLKSTQYVDVGMNPPTTVNLSFTHMLTNVNIDLKMHQANGDAGDVMEVTYILLNGMNCVGSMTEDVWTLSEPSYLWDKLDTPQLLSANAQPCFSNVLMLPQTIEENQVMLYVLYSYQQSGGEPMTKLLETYLPTGEWKAGEKIVYTGTIRVDNSIVFDTPQVESWGTEQVGGTIIIQ